MAVTGINYTGTKWPDLKYESVYLHVHGKDEKLFNTGNFVKDWYDCNKFIITELEDVGHFSNSSSVDHFIMDDAPYESAYLHFDNDEPILKYVDHSDPNYIYTQRDVYEKGVEFFVEAGTEPTWKELKDYCEKKIETNI